MSYSDFICVVKHEYVLLEKVWLKLKKKIESHFATVPTLREKCLVLVTIIAW